MPKDKYSKDNFLEFVAKSFIPKRLYSIISRVLYYSILLIFNIYSFSLGRNYSVFFLLELFGFIIIEIIFNVIISRKLLKFASQCFLNGGEYCENLKLYISNKSYNNDLISEDCEKWFFKARRKLKLVKNKLLMVIIFMSLFILFFLLIICLIDILIFISHNPIYRGFEQDVFEIVNPFFIGLFILYVIIYYFKYSEQYLFRYTKIIIENQEKEIEDLKKNKFEIIKFDIQNEDFTFFINQIETNVISLHNVLYGYNLGDFLKVLYDKTFKFAINYLNDKNDLLDILSLIFEYETKLKIIKLRTKDENCKKRFQRVNNLINQIKDQIRFEIDYQLELFEKPIKAKREKIIIYSRIISFLLTIIGFIVGYVIFYIIQFSI